MPFATRMILILTLTLAIAGGVSAQQPAPATGTTAESSTAPAEASVTSHEIRNQFSRLLSQSPSELATILVLDPTLLSNEAYLAGYPELARFVAAHPEVRRNPRFYLSGFRIPGEGGRVFDVIIEMVGVGFIFVFMGFAFFWLVRTVIEQRRWSRLSKIQTEVHNKILDRFSSSEELLQYIRSPAGTKFLESAPIPLHAAQAPNNPSLTRVMWSVQIGVIVAAAAVGMLLVSGRLEKDAASALFAMGVIALSVGAGFIGSAVVSVLLSRRFGLWQPLNIPASMNGDA